MELGERRLMPRNLAGKIVVGVGAVTFGGLAAHAAALDNQEVDTVSVYAMSISDAHLLPLTEQPASFKVNNCLVLLPGLVELEHCDAPLAPLIPPPKDLVKIPTIPPAPEVSVPKHVEEVVKPPPPSSTTTMAPPAAPEQHAAAVPPPGSHADWMNQAGIPEGDHGYVNYIMQKESGWIPSKVSPNKCIGLGQNCPDGKGNYWLDDTCPNWQDDPVCQLRRFDGYAKGRYKTWRGAYEHKLAYGWW